MQVKRSTGRLRQLCRCRPALWGPFVRGWLRRKQTGVVPCAMPRAKQLVYLPQRDFYESYRFFVESGQGRRELGCFLDRLAPGDVLYDVGGFRGVYTIASKLKLNGDIQVHVFEPLVPNAEAITRICALNQLGDVEVVPRAVGDGSALAGKVHKEDGMLRLGDATATEDVRFVSISLDEYISHGALPPSIMKIDVDGYELSVLNGARNCLGRYRPRLWLEVHPGFLKAQGKSHEQVLAWLRQAGYDITFFADHKLPTWEKAFHVWCVSSRGQAA